MSNRAPKSYHTKSGLSIVHHHVEEKRALMAMAALANRGMAVVRIVRSGWYDLILKLMGTDDGNASPLHNPPGQDQFWDAYAIGMAMRRVGRDLGALTQFIEEEMLVGRSWFVRFHEGVAMNDALTAMGVLILEKDLEVLSAGGMIFTLCDDTYVTIYGSNDYIPF